MSWQSPETSVDQLQRALRAGAYRTRIVQGQAYTVPELCLRVSRGDAWVRTALRAAIAAGLWEAVRVPRKTISGTVQFVPAYRPKAPGKK